MKHSEFEAFIFVGTRVGSGGFGPSYILNNDEELSVSRLGLGETTGYRKFNVKMKNLFSTKEAKELKKKLSEPLTTTVSYYKGEDWRRESVYEDEPIKVKFEAIRVNVDVSCFNIDGLE